MGSDVTLVDCPIWEPIDGGQYVATGKATKGTQSWPKSADTRAASHHGWSPPPFREVRRKIVVRRFGEVFHQRSRHLTGGRGGQRLAQIVQRMTRSHQNQLVELTSLGVAVDLVRDLNHELELGRLVRVLSRLNGVSCRAASFVHSPWSFGTEIV